MNDRVHPQQALSVYAESLAVEAHVAVFGDATLGLAQRLAAMGARSVQLWDPNPERAREGASRGSEGIVVRPYSVDDVPLRGVDLAIVPDLGLFDDPAELIARVRELAGASGVALVGAVNRDADPVGATTRPFDYYELFERVADEFAVVRMVAQLPFRGVALVALGETDDSPAVSVDTQLVEHERTPVAFVAVACQVDPPIDPYVIIELPPEPAAIVRVVDVGAVERVTEELEASRQREAALNVRAATLVTQSAELESLVAMRSRQLAELTARMEDLRRAAEAGQALAVEIEPLARRAELAEREGAALAAELGRQAEAHVSELVRFEEALQERAQTVRRLEGEIARRDGIVRELLGVIEDASVPGAAAARIDIAPAAVAPPAGEATGADAHAREDNRRLRERLDVLALELARREGEAQAAAWRLAELEQKLAMTEREDPVQPRVVHQEAPLPDEGDGVHVRLAAAEEELGVLRQALSQEHAVRVKLESGEELLQARADLERLTALLEQAVAERGLAPTGLGDTKRHEAGSSGL
jgi:hypothetical protein